MLQWLPPSLYAVFIFYLSSLPFIGLPRTMDLLDPGRLVSHLVEYLPLGFLSARAVSKTPGLASFHPLLFPVILGGSYSISDEIHQIFVPGRTASVFDAVADTVGVLLGAFIFSLWSHRGERHKL